MSTGTAYSPDFVPPAPVLAVRVSAPSGTAGVALVLLVDTGADLSMLPESTAAALALPVVSSVRLQGVTGVAQSVRVHAAKFELAGKTRLVEVACLGEEALIGRDILNAFVMKLDGPRGVLELRSPPGGGTPTRRLRQVRTG